MKSNKKTASIRPSDAFKRKVEMFRVHYKSEYGVELDNETIYFFIRVNEMQSQLERKIEKIPQVRFRSGWDYFLYGLGKSLKWVLIIVTVFGVHFIIKIW